MPGKSMEIHHSAAKAYMGIGQFMIMVDFEILHCYVTRNIITTKTPKINQSNIHCRILSLPRPDSLDCRVGCHKGLHQFHAGQALPACLQGPTPARTQTLMAKFQKCKNCRLWFVIWIYHSSCHLYLLPGSQSDWDALRPMHNLIWWWFQTEL